MITTACVPAGVAVIVSHVNGRHPASDGAHRLGWWLAGREHIEDAADGVALLCGQSIDWLERVVTGEIEPGEDEREKIAIGTIGGVLPEDWDHGGPLPWGRPPSNRVAPKPRGAVA